MADGNLTTRTAATSAVSTDLLYLARSPFGATDDRKITVADFFATPDVGGFFAQDDVSNQAGIKRAGEAFMELWNQTATPAQGTTLGGVRFDGQNDNGDGTTYSQIIGAVNDDTDDAEYGNLILRAKFNGADFDFFKHEGSQTWLRVMDNQSLGTFKIVGTDDYSYLQIASTDGSEQMSLMGSHTFSNGSFSTVNASAAGGFTLGSTVSSAAFTPIAGMQFTGIDDAVTPNTVQYANQRVMILDSTSGSEYAHWSLNIIRDGDDSETALEFFNLLPLTAGAVGFDQFSIGSGSVGLIVSPASAEADGLPLLMLGQEGGEALGAGYNGGLTIVASGNGSDAAADSEDAGGNSGDINIGASYAGAGDGVGANGTVGRLALGWVKFSAVTGAGLSDTYSDVYLGNPDSSPLAKFDTTNNVVTWNGLFEKKASVSLADDATITLATGVAGIISVWTEAEYIQVYVDTAGTISGINGSANTATTDSDGDLCVYDGGTGAVIKNRLGSEKTVRYMFNYS